MHCGEKNCVLAIDYISGHCELGNRIDTIDAVPTNSMLKNDCMPGVFSMGYGSAHQLNRCGAKESIGALTGSSLNIDATMRPVIGAPVNPR
ncbi:MAG: hypothetical protein ACI9DC_001711 [Gammaproteobacteria bacterium]|jgi:hypothetical protein